MLTSFLFIKKVNKKNNIKFYIIYSSFLLLFSIVFYYKNKINADEGIILNGAWNLVNNKSLYIDFFEYMTPGGFYLIYWSFKLFGPYYCVANIISILLIFGSSLGIYTLSDLIKKTPLNIITPFIFLLSLINTPIINHNLYSTFFLIWSSYFIAIGIKKNKYKYFICGGIFSGLSVIFLQQKGLLFLGATGLFLLIQYFIKRQKQEINKIIIYSFFSLLIISIFLLNWSLTTLYYNLIDFPIFNYWEVSKKSFSILIFFFVIYLNFLFFLRNKDKKINYLLFIQPFLLISAIPLPDIYHIILIIFPLLVLTPALYIKNKFYFNKIIIFIFLITTILYSSATIKSFTFFYDYKKNHESNIINYIKNECPGEYLYSGPFMPNVYLETQKLNATPFGILIENFSTKDQFKKALQDFKKNNPSCAILWYYPNIKNHFKHTGNNILESYIRENYELKFQEQENGISIYKKNN